MANNIDVLDAASVTKTVKTTDNAGVHTPHQNIEIAGTTPSLNSGAIDSGTLRVVIASGAASIAKAEDAASADGDVGVPMMAVRQSTPANSSGADGDYEFLRILDGLLQTRALQPAFSVQVDITRPADTTPYAVNDALANSTSSPTSGGFTAANVSRVSGSAILLTDMTVSSSNNAATTLQGEVLIFNTSVTAVNDNAAMAISDAEVKTLVARIPFTLVAGANNSFVDVQNINKTIIPSGSADLRFLVQVKNVYTPANAEVISVRFSGIQVS